MQHSDMPAGATPETAGAQQSNKGAGLEGVVQVFTNPQELGENLRHGARILFPWLILIALAVGAMYLIAEPMTDAALATPEGRARMQEQLDRAPGMTEEMMRDISIYSTIGFGGIISSVIAPLLVAALMLFLGNFVFAGNARFKQLLAIAIFSSFIGIIGQAVNGLGARLTGNVYFSISLGVLAPEPGQGDALYQFLSLFDLFFIWQIIAAGIALSVVYQLSRNKGYTISVISLGSLGLLGVAMAAMFA